MNVNAILCCINNFTQFEKGVIKSLWNLLDFQKNFGVEFLI